MPRQARAEQLTGMGVSRYHCNLEANKKYVKSFKLKLMPQIGHFVMLEDPEKFNKLLEEVINEL